MGVHPLRHGLPRAHLRQQPLDVCGHAGDRARRPAGARAGGDDDRRHRHRRPLQLLPFRCAARRQITGAAPRPPADADRWAVVRRWSVEQLRHARHRFGDGRPAPRRWQHRSGVGERWVRDQALLRRLQHRATARRLQARLPTRRDRCPASTRARRRRGRRRTGDDRGVHGDARPRRGAGVCVRRLPAARRPPRVGNLHRRRSRAGDVRRRMGRARRHTRRTGTLSGRLTAGRTAAACCGRMATPTPIILDCDPGHDDAIAIVVAAKFTDLLGITTVAGNAPLDRTTRNALIMTTLLDIDVPVHSGAERPLVAEPKHAEYVHGKSGMDGADLPEPSRGVASVDAVDFIIDTCRSTEGVWLVPVGPMTNIALALRAAPDISRRIAGISLMGGGTFGNRSASAEFNIWADPEAAAIVFGYGGPLVMSGLDVTHQLQATPERVSLVRAAPGHLAQVLADLFDFFSGTYVSRHEHMKGAAVHDPCAVLALTHPQLFDRSDHHVVVETRGEHTRGMTLIDRRDLIDRPASNCDVITSIDADRAFGVIVEAIASFSR